MARTKGYCIGWIDDTDWTLYAAGNSDTFLTLRQAKKWLREMIEKGEIQSHEDLTIFKFMPVFRLKEGK